MLKQSKRMILIKKNLKSGSFQSLQNMLKCHFKAKLENLDFHHFLTLLCCILSCAGNHYSSFSWSSPFACGFHYTQPARENLQIWKRTHEYTLSLKSWPPKSSKCHFSSNSRLAPLWPRITLLAYRRYALRVIILNNWASAQIFLWFLIDLRLGDWVFINF